MEQFVRIGKRVINLANVTEIRQSTKLGVSNQVEGIIISFGHPDDDITMYRDDEGYQDLAEWMERQIPIRLMEPA